MRGVGFRGHGLGLEVDHVDDLHEFHALPRQLAREDLPGVGFRVSGSGCRVQLFGLRVKADGPSDLSHQMPSDHIADYTWISWNNPEVDHP